MGRDVEFLFEVGNLRYIKRMWSRFHTPEFANNAEHLFRTLWIALIIASREKVEVDTSKVAKMAILHDLAESRTGDVDILSRQYVQRDEDLALKDMLADTGIEEEFLALWEEYEARKSIEARIVKDADNLDVDFELAEQAANGSSLQRNKQDIRDFVAANKLYTKTAKQIYHDLKTANPHSWWRSSSRNRRNGGDWKK